MVQSSAAELRSMSPEVSAAIASEWSSEEAKSLDQRRSQTNNYTPWTSIPPWSVQPILGQNSSVDGSKDTQALSVVPSPYTPNAAINRKLCLWRGDISSLDVDAVVNPANKGMNGGGGVDGMIHEKAGDRMLWECSHLYGVETGCTKATRAYRLPCRIVLHTVGPVGEDAVALKSCYETALSYLDGSTPLPYPASPIRSVAFCGISTGTYGYPLEAAAKIALETAREWLEKNHESVDRIIFCTWLAKEAATYEQVVPYYFPPASDSGALRHWAKAAANEIAAHLRRKPGLYPSDLEISLLDYIEDSHRSLRIDWIDMVPFGQNLNLTASWFKTLIAPLWPGMRSLSIRGLYPTVNGTAEKRGVKPRPWFGSLPPETSVESSFPDSLFDMVHLEKLELTQCWNVWRDVDYSFSPSMPSPKRRTFMTTIPEGLSNLRNLTAINLSYCGIEFIDAQDASADQPNTLVAQMARTHDSVFANLTSLTSLSLHGNTLKRLPPSIGRLKSLTFLSVARNKLEVLPASILTLSNLQQLWAWNNNITQYPLSLPIYCPALVDLRMVTQGDQLLSVPGLNKTSLEALRSQENVSSYLRRAPKKDPPSTGGIRTTASAIDSPLYDSCNEMVEPLHFSDVQPPCKGLVTHLKQHLDSTKKMKLYRFKLVILGDGGVGKTTTIKALKHAVAGTSSSTKEEVLLANVASDGLDISMLTTVKALKQAAAASSTSKEDAVLSNVATDGVDISMLTVPLDKKRKDELKNVDALSYSCWDFAGQEQYSYSHTFFLGAHSVYFILFDCSKGDSSQGIERVDYWLQLIRARFPESHCVIVGTHTDKLSKKDLPDFKARVYKRYNMVENSDGTLKYTPPPQSQTSRRGEDYYRVANIHFISNSTKDGINALLDQLRSAYSILYKLRRDLEVPTEWLLLEERIMALGTLTDIPMISWNEWRQDALRWFPSMKEDELKKATQFWHETGTLTWFNEHGLRQYICLRPQFLTKTFSAVITAMIGRPKSILKLAELEMVWKGIPSHYHKYLVQILERFDILHRLDDAFFSVQGDLSRSNTPKSGEVTDSQASKNPHNMPPSLPGYALIPVLLPESKPDQLALDSFWPPIVAAAGPVEYARSYTFDFLPNCIFLRLLVRLLHSKWVALIWWRHGIILRKDYARLYVQHDVSERSIHLKIRVPELRGTEAVQRIGSLLDSIAVLISDWLPNARMITTIPCVFSSGVTRSLQWPDVEAAVMAGHSEISIPGHPTETVRLDHVAPDLALLAHSARVYSASELDLANALELGKGGFGVVLKAALDGKSVAVKKLKSREEDEIMGKPNSDVVFTEFRREAWLMARLVHPHIVGLLGICSPPDMGMVLEFMEGGDLFAYLHGKEDKPPAQLTLDDRFELALGVALGMQFLHSFNPPIIHRDLKSPNVLLTFRSPTGEALQRPIPKIADFGLSRGLVWTPKLSVRSVDCPIWLAPELMNQQPYDDKADVYSFGVILYEIALQHLFLSEHKFDTDKESFIHSGSRPRLPDDLDPTLSALITQCWAQSPEDRPSFDQIVSALQTRTMIAAPSASKLNFGGGWDDFVAAAAART